MDSLNNSGGELRNKFVETQKDEQEFIGKITEKYGDGTFNPETGIFTPNKSE